jgi:CubicO group peptidase (beta-lactamase class C family)
MLMHPGVSGQKIEELDLDKLDKYIEEARLAWQVPGLSVAIVKDESVVFARARYLKPAYGFRYEFGYSNIAFLAAGEIVPAATGYSEI